MYKLQNEQIAACYERINPCKARRMRNCANVLVYAQSDNGIKLKNANLCRVRLCPICQWRRSLKNYSQIRAILDYLAQSKNPSYNYIFLTLTVRNCPPEALSDEITHILHAFDYFKRYKRIDDSIEGWYRGLEVTHNTLDNTYHPHIHCLICVTSNYWTTKKYIKQAEWTDLWRQALDVDYDPIVYIERVHGKTCKAVAEVAKYCCKPDDILYYDDWRLRDDVLRVLDQALDRRRLVAYGGLLKDVHKLLHLSDVDDGRLEDIGRADDNGSIITGQDILYAWHTGYCQYVRTDIT